jgi:hypothetical protein
VALSGLVSRPSSGVDEDVDHMTASLRVDALKHRVQPAGSVRVSVADHVLGGGGNGELDARWSCGSGVRSTSPAWTRRSTIAEVAGGLVPTAWANSVRVIGVSALIRCNTVSWTSVIPRPAQTTVLVATTARRWVRSQWISCAVTISASWPLVAR